MQHNNIGQILSKRAFLNPDQDGIVNAESGERASFRQLNESTNQVANALLAMGVRPGERVALLLMNGFEFAESFFAIAKIGGVIVPLNWRLVADELAFILKDSGATTLIFDDAFAKTVADLQARGSQSPQGTDVTRWIHVSTDEIAPFAKHYQTLRDRADKGEPSAGAADDDLLYIMYTSGTTGLPKGAMHTHNTCLWALMTMSPVAEVRRGDRFLHLLPMFHVGALTPVTMSVYLGMTSVIAKAFDAETTWKVIERERVTVMLAVPAMLNFMWQVPDFQTRFDYRSLRWCMSGASPVPVTLIQQYASKGIEIHQIYGLTESCGPACLIDPANAIVKAGSTGKAFFHTEIRVINDAGHDCAPNEPGEVIIRGKHLMKGYWQREQATADTIRNGWLYTGDVATMDADGFVYIMDRTKDMIISGGENIYPAEIENVILGHPKVKEVAVIGQPSEKWGESPFAVVVSTDPALKEQEVIDWCLNKIARFKMPKGAAFIDIIPRNPSGKVLKRVLREQFPGPAPQ